MERMSAANELSSINNDSISNNRLNPDFGMKHLMNNCAETKLLIPSPPTKIVHRPSLIQKLDAILAKRLTVISAPAGFGKTTLISAWVVDNYKNADISWVSLSEEDNNENTFWFYIVLSLKKYVHNILDILSMFSLGHQYQIKNVLNVLINIIHKQDRKCVLILDDYHLINDVNINKAFSYFANNIPPNMHIVLVTRAKPNFALSKLRLKEEILELKSEEIRFNSSEAAELLTKTLEVKLSDEEIKWVGRCAEGWVAALRIIAFSIKKSKDYKKLMYESNCCNEYILEYLSEEILNQLPKNIKDFLYKTSVLQVLNSSICDYILGIDNSQEILETFLKKNIFLVVLDENLSYFRYHHLFSTFLHNKLLKYYKSEVENIYLKASQWYESHGYYQEAIEFALKSENYDNIARLIEIYIGKIAVRGEFHKLIKITEVLPVSVIKSKPRICIYYSVALALLGKLDENESYLRDRGIDLDDGFFDEYRPFIFGIKSIASLHRTSIDTIRVKEYAQKALIALSEENSKDSLDLLLKAIVNSNLGNLSALAGDFDEANRYFEISIEHANQSGNLYVKLSVISKIAQLHYNNGKINLSLELYKDTLSILEKNCLHVYPSVNMIYFGIGLVYYEINELEKAYTFVIKCIELSKVRDDNIKLLLSYILLAKILYAEGKKEESLEVLKEIESMTYNSQLVFILKQYISDIVRLLINTKETEFLEALILKFQIQVSDDVSFLNEDENIAITELYINNKDYDAADLLIEKLLRKSIVEKRQWSKIRLLILSSIIKKLQGNRKKSIYLMKEAVVYSCSCGFIRTFLDFGDTVKELLIGLQKSIRGSQNKEEIEEYIEKLLNHYESNLSNKTDKCPAKIGKTNLSPREQEVLLCIIDGLSNDEISKKLFISISTVKKHIKNIFDKLNVNNRTKAIKAAKNLEICK